MSLVMAISNRNGIVISADKRLTCRTINPNTGLATSVKYFDTEQKVFTTKSGHAIAFTGESMLSNGQFTSEAIEEVIENTGDYNLSVYDELAFIKEKLLPITGIEDTNLLCAGIESGVNKVYVTSLRSDKIIELTENICGIGDVVFAKDFQNTYAPKIEIFSIEKSMEYLRFLNSTIGKLNYFCDKEETISSCCDICVITPTNIQFAPCEAPNEKYHNNEKYHLNQFQKLRKLLHNPGLPV